MGYLETAIELARIEAFFIPEGPETLLRAAAGP